MRDVFPLLCLLLAAWRVVVPAARVTDIRLYDESDYLFAGLRLTRGESLHVALHGTPSPLYALWYAALHHAAPDPLALYVLNFQVLTVSVTLALYGVLRRAGTSPMLSFTASLLYLASGLPLIWPRVTHLALLVLLCSLLAVSFCKSRTARAATLAAGLLLVSYVRAEYVPACVLAGAWLFWETTRARQERAFVARLAPVLTAATVGASVWALFGGPPPAGDSARAWLAFSQHFAVHWVRLHHSSLNPWTDAAPITAGAFGAACTVGGALRANPAAFVGYCVLNLALLPVGMAKALLSGLSAPGAAVVGGTLLLAGIALWRGRARFLSPARPADPIVWAEATALVGITTASAIVLVYPDPHYLLPFIVLLLIGAARRLDCAWPASARLGPRTVAALCAAAAILAPPLSSAWYKQSPPPAPFGTPFPMETRRTIEFLRLHLPGGGPQRILEADGGYAIYLGPQCVRVAETDKQTAFGDFLTTQRITAVVVSPLLLQDSRFLSDPQFADFQRNPARRGFTRMDIPRTHQTLYTKIDTRTGIPLP